MEGRLAKTVAALDKNQNASLAFCDLIPMNQLGQKERPWVAGRAPSLTDLQTHRCGIYPSAVTIRRSVYESCGGFDENLPKLADSFLWMRAREQGEFAYVPEALAIYRTTEFPLLADKYLAGFNPFVRAVRKRYGKRVSPLLAEFATVFAGSLIAKAAMELDEGLPLAALRTVARALAVRPSYVLELAVKRHVVSYRNLRRLLRASAWRERADEDSAHTRNGSH